MMKKGYMVLILILLVGAIFSSCAKEEFTSTLSCNELSKSLEKEFSGDGQEFSCYSKEELKFLFPDTDVYEDGLVIYSSDGVDITEIGIMRAKDENDAIALLEDAKGYIKDIQEQKREFLQNYSPSELSKLNSAEARRFGQYVIFTIAEPYESNAVFSAAEKCLKK